MLKHSSSISPFDVQTITYEKRKNKKFANNTKKGN
jgi:hypothetical protein